MEIKDYVIGVLVLIALVLGFFVYSGMSASKPNVINTSASSLGVYYLYPKRCVNCDPNVPGQCDFCASYYDDRVVASIGGSLGVDMKFSVSDAVDVPNVFVVSGRNAGLIDAKSKYSIAAGICAIAGVKESCAAFADEVNRTRACVQGKGIPEDTIIYYYSTSGCAHCDRSTPFVDSLSSDVSYNDTFPYKVKKLDSGNVGDRKLAGDCLGSFANLDYVPQVICPKTGNSITGELSGLSQLRDFADKCIEAG